MCAGTQMGVKVLVLEARDRVGGRVHTHPDAIGVPVDLGASIITGGNCVYTFLCFVFLV